MAARRVAAGVPALRFHDLRRTAATAMVAAGVDVRTAQARLGHADPRVTLAIYAQVVSNADRHAAHQLQALLMDPSTRASTNQRRRITDEVRCRGARWTRDGRRKGTLGVLAGSGRKWPLTCPNPQPEPAVGIEPTTFALRVRPFSSPTSAPSLSSYSVSRIVPVVHTVPARSPRFRGRSGQR